ncbi:MAG: hypothetical protein LH613_08295 [Chamaesiphon sp.]|nr:hypothetical protein [Chamaesiphon sp.]
MTDRFESLDNGEVISVQQETQVLSGQKTFRVGEINDAIRGHLEKAIADWNEHNNDWFSSQGIDCEALRFGSNGWEKGRIRLCLEFCPDRPNPPDRSITSSSIPKAIDAAVETIGSEVSPPPAPENSTIATNVFSEYVQPTVTTAIAAPEITAPTHDVTPISVTEYLKPTEIADPSAVFAPLPVVGIATIGAIAVAAAAPVREAVTSSIPHAETTLELEHLTDPNAPDHGGFDEIAFDFDLANNDRGIMIPNGMMELDLTDLDLDFSEDDLLDFEHNGMSEVAESIDLQDLDRSANSGMLIDEVWNEMNQANWPGIN